MSFTFISTQESLRIQSFAPPPPGSPPTHLVGAVGMLYPKKLGQRAPAEDKLADQDAVGVLLELNEVPAGGEDGHRGVSAGDYTTVPAGGLPPPSVDGLAEQFRRYKPATATTQEHEEPTSGRFRVLAERYLCRPFHGDV